MGFCRALFIVQLLGRHADSTASHFISFDSRWNFSFVCFGSVRQSYYTIGSIGPTVRFEIPKDLWLGLARFLDCTARPFVPGNCRGLSQKKSHSSFLLEFCSAAPDGTFTAFGTWLAPYIRCFSCRTMTLRNWGVVAEYNNSAAFEHLGLCSHARKSELCLRNRYLNYLRAAYGVVQLCCPKLSEWLVPNEDRLGYLDCTFRSWAADLCWSLGYWDHSFSRVG